MRVLLDTNVYSAMMRGHPRVIHRIRNAEEVILSGIVAGELLLGFRAGSRFSRNLDDLEKFLANPFVTFLPITLTTADRFSRIAAALRKKGAPLPTNDIWIAASAMETGAELLSFDRHFEHIDGLVWTNLEAEGAH